MGPRSVASDRFSFENIPKKEHDYNASSFASKPSGANHGLFSSFLERDVPVSNIPSYGTASVAQHTFALILELTINAKLHSDAARAGEWSECKDWCYWKTPLTELEGKTLGIVGFGRIGRRVAEVGNAFGMRIVAQDSVQTDKWKKDCGCE